jgi:hypothetical protein
LVYTRNQKIKKKIIEKAKKEYYNGL